MRTILTNCGVILVSHHIPTIRHILHEEPVPAEILDVVVCNGQVRWRGSLMHELISPDSAIDPLVTSQSGVCCKQTSASHLVVKLHSLYRCCLVLWTPYACSPDRSWERVHCCLRCSPCYSSAFGVGRSFSTLLLPRSLVAESTACVCRFRRLSFLLAPSLGTTVEWCLEWRVFFMGLGLSS